VFTLLVAEGEGDVRCCGCCRYCMALTLPLVCFLVLMVVIVLNFGKGGDAKCKERERRVVRSLSLDINTSKYSKYKHVYR